MALLHKKLPIVSALRPPKTIGRVGSFNALTKKLGEFWINRILIEPRSFRFYFIRRRLRARTQLTVDHHQTGSGVIRLPDQIDDVGESRFFFDLFADEPGQEVLGRQILFFAR